MTDQPKGSKVPGNSQKSSSSTDQNMPMDVDQSAESTAVGSKETSSQELEKKVQKIISKIKDLIPNKESNDEEEMPEENAPAILELLLEMRSVLDQPQTAQSGQQQQQQPSQASSTISHPQFLWYSNNNLFKCILEVLDLLMLKVPIAYQSDDSCHRARYLVLEIIQRFPYSSEYIKPFAGWILGIIMRSLESDNEENAMICLRIIIEIHKNCRGQILVSNVQNRTAENSNSDSSNPNHTGNALTGNSEQSNQVSLENYVQPFFDFVRKLLENMPNNVAELIESSITDESQSKEDAKLGKKRQSETASSSQSSLNSVQNSNSSSNSNILIESDQPKKFAKATKSFKVLSECPIILVLLIQIHKRFIGHSVPDMVPLIIQAVSLRVSVQNEWACIKRQNIDEASGETTDMEPKIFVRVGPSPSISARNTYSELIAAQVKIMSFLAYIIRGFATSLKPKQQKIAESVIKLLMDCPSEASSIRKELLVAARHILSTEFREAFIPYIDVMFLEEVLVGNSITSRETLRPLAYSMLADLIHHVRQSLRPEQIVRTVLIYAKNLHDSSLAPSIQTMCAKLLLNLIDCIVNLSDKNEGRRILVLLLDAFAGKFASLKDLIPKLNSRKSEEGLENTQSSQNEESGSEIGYRKFNPFKLDPKCIVNPEHLAPIGISTVIQDHYQADVSKDYKFLFKTLVLGLKTIVFGMRNLSMATASARQLSSSFNAPVNSPQSLHQTLTPPYELDYEEQHLFVRLFVDGIACFELYRVDSNSRGPDEASIKAVGRGVLVQKEEKEILEHFVTIFTLVDAPVFFDVFNSQIGMFFDALINESALLAIPQYLLASEAVSKNFSGILMQYLMDNLEKLGAENSTVSNMILRLFKLVFMAVTLFPDSNEAILQPHIGDLITRSMKLASSSQEPNNYYLLLRALFRNIGGGRFEMLYKEVLPLLPTLLRDLNVLLESTQRKSSRDLYVELSLTVPVRLSVLLPYLHYLMKPLVIALQAGPELVSQGLRTLELCIDNLTAEFLDPILRPVIKDMMKALWEHLRPSPYRVSHSHTTLRILGKMGGRNRRILRDSLELEFERCSDSGLRIPLPLKGTDAPVLISLKKPLKTACRALCNIEDDDIASVRQSFDFLSSCLPLLIDTEVQMREKLAFVLENRKQIIQNDLNEARNLVESDRERLEKLISIKEELFIETYGNVLGQFKFNLTEDSRNEHSQHLEDILEHLIYCATFSDISSEAFKILKNLGNHFAILKIEEYIATNVTAFRATKASRVDCIDSNVFISAIVSAMTCDRYSNAFDVCKNLLLDFRDALMVLMGGDKVAVNKLPVFHFLATKLCSACYKPEWYIKMGGCNGISFLVNELDLGQKWVIDHELEFSKALLYTLKDIPVDLAGSSISMIEQTFIDVLEVCNKPCENDADIERQAIKFQNLMSLQIAELLNSNEDVRSIVQKAFKSLAELKETSVTELLRPVKDRLLTPIFSKPLRALPFSMQVGRIDAITFCLSLNPPLLDFNDELVRLLTEAIALADSEDSFITGRQNQDPESLNNLRIVCVRLLSVAMSLNEFSSSQKLNPTRFRIVQVFFKSLYSKSPEVVEAAKRGVQQALSLQNHRLPKELLQTGLRPILLNLSDAKRLTPDGLSGLARLLELLSNYFKVEIGRKLLDHLNVWATPQILEGASSKPLCEPHEIQVIAGVLELIHLLPPAANIFMEDMIRKTIQLEDGIRRCISSPFRSPLAKYLNRYSSDAVEFLLKNMNDLKVGRLFVDLLDHPNCPNLSEELKNRSTDLLDVSFLSQEQNINPKLVAALAIEKISVKDPSWLKENNGVYEVIIDHWRTNDKNRLAEEEKRMDLTELYHWKVISKIVIIYVRQSPDDVDALFDLVDAFMLDSIVDFGVVNKFFLNEVIFEYSVAHKKKIMEKFLEALEYEDIYPKKTILLLRTLIIPMVGASLERDSEGSKIFDEKILGRMHKLIWLPSVTGTKLFGTSLDENWMQLEFFQLVALVLKHVPSITSPFRKDLIRSSWSYLKHEDSILKFSAFVVVALFVNSYDIPQKMILQLLRALLRTYQSESRILVRQSLDILFPALPTKLKEESNRNKEKRSLPPWIFWPRKILIEDHHSVAQSVAIWQTITRYPDLFYEYRGFFVQMIVTSLAKYGLANSATTDTRRLSIDLAELILCWERRRVAESSHSTMEIEKPNNISGFEPSQALREIILNFLLRLICAVQEPHQKQGWCSRIVRLGKAFLSEDIWPETRIKISFLEKYFANSEINDNNSRNIPFILEFVEVIFDGKPIEFVAQNIHYLRPMIEKCAASDNPKIIDPVIPIVQKAYNRLNGRLELSISMNDFLKSFTSDCLAYGRNLYACVSLLKSISTTYEPAILNNISNISKLFQRMCKDYPVSVNSSNSPTQVVLYIVTTIMDILYQYSGHLNENRAQYFDAVVTLIDKSNESQIHLKILEIISDSIFKQNECFLAASEKALVMKKFAVLEGRTEKAIYEKYLNLILQIYNEESLSNSELLSLLEPVFMLSTRYDNVELQSKFLRIFDEKLPKNSFIRLGYILGVQNWEFLCGEYWISQALSILLGVVEGDKAMHRPVYWAYQTAPVFFVVDSDANLDAQEAKSESLNSFIENHVEFLKSLNRIDISGLVYALRAWSFKDKTVARIMWAEIFSHLWGNFNPKERHDINKYFISLLTKSYHKHQMNERYNVIETLLNGANFCEPTPNLPPQLLKHLAKTFNCWYISIDMIEKTIKALSEDATSNRENEKIRQMCLESIEETYLALSEEDYYFGMWKNRSMFNETKLAISYEQIGLWKEAQKEYENSQIKARNGQLPLAEGEFLFWEDRWISCTQKLQQWDVCLEVAKHQTNPGLQLECHWRISDWSAEKDSINQAIAAIADDSNPRFKIFEAFSNLCHLQELNEKLSEIQRISDEGVQLCLQRWHSFPSHVTDSHIPVLHLFQQFVELQEAAHMYMGLLPSTKLQTANELKGTLGTWRDRLPNQFDDINIWSELVSWRQHVFGVINRSYQSTGDQNQQQNAMTFRGYHEIAWIINRYAHVARKQGLLDVCVNSLNKIYTLPNIEINDAFLKLREQSKCFFQKSPTELASGLEVINNTNLAYFQQHQRAEFFALKGIFLGKLKMEDEANSAFSSAIQIDSNLPKGWASWANYNDKLFEEKNSIKWGANAINSYLQAAGLYKSSRCRKYLMRILWLLHLDDSHGTISKAYEAYKGEVPTWYWVTFIPQLLTALNRPEAKHAKSILIRIAKQYPQALYFSLRTTREDLIYLKSQIRGAASQSNSLAASPANEESMDVDSDSEKSKNPDSSGTKQAEASETENDKDGRSSAEAANPLSSLPGTPRSSSAGIEDPKLGVKRDAWVHVEDIMSILKTAYPLLTLSMETSVDQILARLKPTADEEVYRIIMALLHECFQPLYSSFLNKNSSAPVSAPMRQTIERFINSPYISTSQFKEELEADFIRSSPSLEELLMRYRKWRSKLEKLLDSRIRTHNLEHFSSYLVEFEYQKFEDIEVPGQYLELKDSNDDFRKIHRFYPQFQYVKGHGIWCRRITMIGKDGSVHSFNIHNPSSRNSRREERMMQAFRLLNSVLEKRKESSKRNLQFHLPKLVPLASTVRLIEDDSSNISMQQIFEKHCEKQEIEKDEVMMYYLRMAKEFIQNDNSLSNDLELNAFQAEIVNSIAEKFVPRDILSKFFLRNMVSYSDFWIFRKSITNQLAMVSFMSHVFKIGHRMPHKIVFSRTTGKIMTTDLLPMVSSSMSLSNPEAVPFRLTPNLVNLVTDIGIEGPFVGSLLALASSLTQPGFDLEHYLAIFVRDELAAWRKFTHPNGISAAEFHSKVLQNLQMIRSSISSMILTSNNSSQPEVVPPPISKPLMDLISQATSAQNQALMDINWQPWL